MPNFNAKFTCKLTDFGGLQLLDRGHIDLTGHIDAQGNVRGGENHYVEGSTAIDYTVDGSIKQSGGLWVLHLERSDRRAVYRGILIKDDAAKDELSFVARKFIMQPIAPDRIVNDRKSAVEAMRRFQDEEPWIITKP